MGGRNERHAGRECKVTPRPFCDSSRYKAGTVAVSLLLSNIRYTHIGTFQQQCARPANRLPRERRVGVNMEAFLLIPVLAIAGLILFLPQIAIAFVVFLLVANVVVAIWIRLDDRRIAKERAELDKWMQS